MSLAVTQIEQGAVEVALPVLQDTFNHYHANPDTARFRMSEAEVSLNLGLAHLQLGNARSALPLFNAVSTPCRRTIPGAQLWPRTVVG